MKTLPMSLPTVSHAPANSYLLSILLNYTKSMSWIVENFINFHISIDTKWDQFYSFGDIWYGCPLVAKSCLTWEYFEATNSNLYEFVKKAIELDYYVYINVNRKYINIYNTEREINHNPMIYGYDDCSFNVCEFFPAHKLECQKIAIAEFSEGVKHYLEVEEPSKYKGIWLLKYKLDYEYEFSLDILKARLVEHLYSTNLFKKFNSGYIKDSVPRTSEFKNYIFGLDYYNVLIMFIEEADGCFIKARPFHLLVFRNYIMELRIQFLINKGFALEKAHNEFGLLKRETEKLQNILIKSNILQKIDKTNLKEQVKLVKKLDEKYTKIFLDELSQ